MKKTIDEIVNNAEYKALNNALNERCKEIAEKVREEMCKLDLAEFRLPGTDFICWVCSVKTRSGFCRSYLAIADDYCDRQCNSLEGDESYYFTGDFNCRIIPATWEEKRAFLNAAKDVFESIDEIKEERISEMKKALQNTESL